MTVEFFNGFYFMYVILGVATFFGLYFFLRNKSFRFKRNAVGIILLSNLALHFLKLNFAPYVLNPDKAMRDIWFINVCAMSVVTFPLYYYIKSKSAKDFMFYLGVISGFLAFLIPTEALGENPFLFDVIRFYICHFIIIAGPLLMVILGIHKLDYKRIPKVPLYMALMLILIAFQQVLQYELGIINLRSTDFLEHKVHNPSLIWGPSSELAVLFTIFTPNFMKVVPYGEFIGQEKYWPFFYMLPGILFYFTVLPLLICLPWQFKQIRTDVKNAYLFIKDKTRKITRARS